MDREDEGVQSDARRESVASGCARYVLSVCAHRKTSNGSHSRPAELSRSFASRWDRIRHCARLISRTAVLIVNVPPMCLAAWACRRTSSCPALMSDSAYGR